MRFHGYYSHMLDGNQIGAPYILANKILDELMYKQTLNRLIWIEVMFQTHMKHIYNLLLLHQPAIKKQRSNLTLVGAKI
jgi:hypothetical protein